MQFSHMLINPVILFKVATNPKDRNNHGFIFSEPAPNQRPAATSRVGAEVKLRKEEPQHW